MDQAPIAHRSSRSSHSAKSFSCSWESCSKTFSRKSDLARHYRIHTNERNYICGQKDCNKAFIQRSALTVHERVHSGHKPHSCHFEGCQKAFSDSSSLARHRRTHTGIRNFKCPQCDSSFCRKTTLIKHQKRSHRVEDVSGPESSEGSESDSLMSPPSTIHPISSDRSLTFQHSNLEPSLGPSGTSIHPQRSQSLSCLVNVNQEPMYSPGVQYAHRYSFSDHLLFSNDTPRPYDNTQISQRPPVPAKLEFDFSQSETSSKISKKLEHELGGTVAPNSSYPANQLSQQPNPLSQEKPQFQEIYYHQSPIVRGFHSLHVRPEYGIQYSRPENIPEEQTRNMLPPSQPIGSYPRYQPDPTGQINHMQHNNLPYQIGRDADQSRQPDSLVGYPIEIAHMQDWYTKPEELDVLRNPQEFMSPSMRVTQMSEGI